MSFPIHRPRRLRVNQRIRSLVKETHLRPSSLILPLFVEDGIKRPEPILAMPGQFRWSSENVLEVIEEALESGINSVLFFGSPDKKDSTGSASRDQKGVVPRALRNIKKKFPETILVTDVCLCAYTDHGHCGVLDKNGVILNDESLPYLSEMALAHARAGADIIAPSDMMDGRIARIRDDLDEAGFTNTAIMSYSAKYSSCFYGPFREAAHSAPSSGDRKSYQMDPGSRRQAIMEIEEDAEEGADIVMVKPAMPYLDIIRDARDLVVCPIAAYQVSGEFSMIKAAAKQGWVDEKAAVLESLTSIHRAGADIILTYFAIDAAKWIKEMS